MSEMNVRLLIGLYEGCSASIDPVTNVCVHIITQSSPIDFEGLNFARLNCRRS